MKRYIYKTLKLGLLINFAFALGLVVIAPFGILRTYSIYFEYMDQLESEYIPNPYTNPPTISKSRYVAMGLDALTVMFIISCYIAVSHQLYTFFSEILNGNYFVRKNGIRLRIIGGAIMLASGCMVIYNFILARIYYLITFVNLGEVTGESSDYFVLLRYIIGIFLGLMFIIVGEAFIKGNELEEDNKLTV